MADLIATAAVSGLPLSHGDVTLSAFDPGPVSAIAPYPGRDLPGLPFPAPGAVLAHGGGRLVWAGREMAFLLGVPAPDLAGLAAVTDQSDGWVWLVLEGAGAAGVLARLCPLDLRPVAFAPGTAARSVLGHLPVLMIRTGPERFELAAFRSMAGTLVHELEAAMRGVAARRAL